MAKDIATTLPAWRGHVKKRLAEEKLDAFAMHFLFVPFPSVDGFRQLLRDNLGVAKTVTPAAASAPIEPNAPEPKLPAAAAKSAKMAKGTPNGTA